MENDGDRLKVLVFESEGKSLALLGGTLKAAGIDASTGLDRLFTVSDYRTVTPDVLIVSNADSQSNPALAHWPDVKETYECDSDLEAQLEMAIMVIRLERGEGPKEEKKKD